MVWPCLRFPQSQQMPVNNCPFETMRMHAHLLSAHYTVLFPSQLMTASFMHFKPMVVLCIIVLGFLVFISFCVMCYYIACSCSPIKGGGGDNNRNNRHGLESNTVPAVHYFCSAEGQYYVKDVVILYIGASKELVETRTRCHPHVHLQLWHMTQ